MRLMKWIACITILIIIQLGKNVYINPSEVVAIGKTNGETVYIILQGGSKIYTNWPIPRVMGALFDRETIEQQLKIFGGGFKVENEKKMLRDIRKYNKDTIFDIKRENK